MRILYIGNGGYKYNAQRFYLSDTRFVNGLTRNGHMVWFFSDRDLLRMLSPLHMRYFGLSKVNQALMKVVHQLQPDAILLGAAEIVTTRTLRKIRQYHPHIRIGQINVDPIFNPYKVGRYLDRTGGVDMQFFTTGGPALRAFATETQPCYFIPNPIDASIDTGRAHEIAAPQFDLTCAMTVDTRFVDGRTRQALALGVAEQLPQLKTCYRGFGGRPMLRGQEYIRTYGNSAMALSLSQHISGNAESTPEQRYLYSSDRIAHVMGNGSLAFVADMFALDKLFTNEEIVLFSGLDDLVEKVRFYAEHPGARRERAKRGWQKVHRDFETMRVMRFVMERLMDKPLSEEYPWPTEGYYKGAGAA